MKLPIGSKKYDVSSGTVTFTLSGHTALVPRLAIFKRKIPDAKGYSSYQLKLVRGVLQTDGSVKNVLWDLTVRNVSEQAAGDSTAMLASMLTILGSSDVASDIGDTLNLPQDLDVLT